VDSETHANTRTLVLQVEPNKRCANFTWMVSAATEMNADQHTLNLVNFSHQVGAAMVTNVEVRILNNRRRKRRCALFIKMVGAHTEMGALMRTQVLKRAQLKKVALRRMPKVTMEAVGVPIGMLKLQIKVVQSM